MAKDPICDVEVDEETAEFKSQYAARRTIFAQQNAKNNLNSGQNNMCVPRKNDVSDGSRFRPLVGVPVSDGTPSVAAEKSQLSYCFFLEY